MTEQEYINTDLLAGGRTFRSECKCPCHLPNVNIRHMFPCCEPDPIPEQKETLNTNDEDANYPDSLR